MTAPLPVEVAAVVLPIETFPPALRFPPIPTPPETTSAPDVVLPEAVVLPTEIFPPKLIPWHYTNSGIVFFAGSINYYPNFLAVKWLISELSPKL
jgi:hypothetical protein